MTWWFEADEIPPIHLSYRGLRPLTDPSQEVCVVASAPSRLREHGEGAQDDPMSLLQAKSVIRHEMKDTPGPFSVDPPTKPQPSSTAPHSAQLSDER